MKLAVFGATGSLGRVIVQHAIDTGHEVTGLSRSGEGPEGVQMVKGDVMNAEHARRVVKGQDAVIVALGGGSLGGLAGKTRSEGTASVMAAMEAEGVTRLICLSSLGVGDSEYVLNFWWRRIMFGLLLNAVYRDHHRQEKLVRRSNLDWTIVRPGAFADGPATGDFHVGDLRRLRGKLKLSISKADIAGFMVGQVNSREHVGAATSLSY